VTGEESKNVVRSANPIPPTHGVLADLQVGVAHQRLDVVAARDVLLGEDQARDPRARVGVGQLAQLHELRGHRLDVHTGHGDCRGGGGGGAHGGGVVGRVGAFVGLCEAARHRRQHDQQGELWRLHRHLRLRLRLRLRLAVEQMTTLSRTQRGRLV
jgi:hypothetical protein